MIQSNIKTKNDLAKHLSKGWDYKNIIEIINEVNQNLWKYYYNHKDSDKEKNKFNRVAMWPLELLNRLINDNILKELDKKLPNFIFWGVLKKNHIQAVKIHKSKYNRTFIKFDLERYFDQIDIERIIWNLVKKFWCYIKGASEISKLCCVPEWEFFNSENKKVLARWFHTSTRIAILCSLDFFKQLNFFLQRHYKDLNPKISVFVDDITISIDNTTEDKINDLMNKVYELWKKHDLKLNHLKTQIDIDCNELEILWVKLNHLILAPWKKTKQKRNIAYMKWNKWDKSAIVSIKWHKNYRKVLDKASW